MIQHRGTCQVGTESQHFCDVRQALGLGAGWWTAASPVFQKRAGHSRTQPKASATCFCKNGEQRGRTEPTILLLCI